MFHKSLISLGVLVALLFGQNLNYNGNNDTGTFASFKADSLKYSAIYSLSGFENLRVDMMANDTNAAGYASDSIKFVWGIQTGHPAYNRSGLMDTVWCDPLLVDTMQVSNATKTYIVLGTDGTFSTVKGLVDTLTVTGYAYQSRNFAPEWDVWFRVWARGITGNRVGGWVKSHYAVYRRVASGVRAK